MKKKLAKSKGPKMPGVPSRSIRRSFPQVKHVVDSTKQMGVIVQSRDCVEGKKMQASECALARATRRQYHADAAVIGLSFSYIIKGDTAVRFKTPTSVAREIVSFDRHQDFAPGKYALSPVAPTARQGAWSKKDHGKSHSPKRITHHTVRVRELE